MEIFWSVLTRHVESAALYLLVHFDLFVFFVYAVVYFLKEKLFINN